MAQGEGGHVPQTDQAIRARYSLECGHGTCVDDFASRSIGGGLCQILTLIKTAEC